MSDRDTKSDTKSSSSSLLSPLAQPFNANTNRQPSLDSFLLDRYAHEFAPQSQPLLLHSDSIATSSSSLADTVSWDHYHSLSSLPYRTFLQQDECTLPHSSEYTSSQALVPRTSGANETLMCLKPSLPETVVSCCSDAVINDENSVGRLSRAVDSCGDAAFIMESHILLKAKDKMVCREKFPIGKGKAKKNGELTNVAIDPLFIEKSELPTTSQKVPDVFSLELHDIELGLPHQCSSVELDQNDSDVDSPCWKGTGAHQSPFGVTMSVRPQLPETETEPRKALNPLAPHFFPQSAKGSVEYHDNDYQGNDSFSFQQTASAVVPLSSEEHRLIGSMEAGTFSPEVSNIIGAQRSNDTYVDGRECMRPKKSNSCSVSDSSHVGGPFLVEDYLTSSGQGVTGLNIAGSVDTIRNGSSSVNFAMTRNFLTSSCSGDGVPCVVNEKLRGAAKSVPPKLDVKLVISTMHDLSELLRWNYSSDLDSTNEHQYNMIQHIINNLYMCMMNEVGQRVSIPESGHQCTSYSPIKLSDRHKVTSMNFMTVPHDLETQKCSATFSKNLWGPAPTNDEGIKKSDECTRIIGNTMRDNHQILEETSSLPLLYGNSQVEVKSRFCL